MRRRGNVQLGEHRQVAVAVIVLALVVIVAGVILRTVGQPDSDPARPSPAAGSTSQTRPTASTSPPPTPIETRTSTLTFDPRSSPTTAEDEALAARFMELAASPDRARVEALPLADRVMIGLGTTLLADKSSEELQQLAGWTLDGFGEQISLLEVAGAPRAGTVTLVGDHPRCVSPALAPPVKLAQLRRVAIEADPAAIGSCVEWWRIELYVTPNGDVVAVTLDQWEW